MTLGFDPSNRVWAFLQVALFYFICRNMESEFLLILAQSICWDIFWLIEHMNEWANKLYLIIIR